MAVHPCGAAVEQDRAAVTACDGAVDGSADRGRQGHLNDLAAFAADPQDPVAVFVTEITDIRAGGFEDPKSQQTEHGDEREVVCISRVPRSSEQRLELQMRVPERGRLGGHCWAADILGRRTGDGRGARRW